MGTKIYPNWQADDVLGCSPGIAQCHLHQLSLRGLFLLPTGGAVFRAGTPEVWTAPNGVEVVVTRKGRINHFHTSYDDDGWGVLIPTGWDAFTVAVANHRHLGPARHALRAFAKEFVVDACAQAFELRRLVREGD